MKVKLTETQIRSLLRERIARRLLMEEAPPPPEPQQLGGITLGDIAKGVAAAATPFRSSSPTVMYTKFGQDRSKNSTAVEAIGELTGAQTFIGPNGAQFGPGAGDEIATWHNQYVDWMAKSIQFGTDDPLVTWKRNANSYSKVPGFNPETGAVDSTTSISLPDDARGLLAYLLLVREGNTGLKKVEDVLKLLAAEEDINAEIEKWVETFRLRNLRISGDEALSVAESLLNIAKSDSGQRNCFRTRYALAKFAQSNTKYGETALAKAVDLGMWMLTIAELPATAAGLLGVGVGTGLRGARFLGVAEPLAADAAKLGTVAGTRERVAAQLAASGETAVSGARAASKAAQIGAREKAYESAWERLNVAGQKVDDAKDGLESLVASIKKEVKVADDLGPAKEKMLDAIGKGKLDPTDAKAVADEISDVLPQTPASTDSKLYAQELKLDIDVMTAKIRSRLQDIEDAKEDLKAAEGAFATAKQEEEAAKHLLDTLEVAAPAELGVGREASIARRAKVKMLAVPTSQSSLVFRTARDFAAATGIRGLLGAVTASGITTTALGLLAFSGWAKISVSRDKLEILAAMAIPDQLGELADEFTNTFFGNYYVAEGIDDVEDAIYAFASKKSSPEQSDLDELKKGLQKGIAYARQTPEEMDTDEEGSP